MSPSIVWLWGIPIIAIGQIIITFGFALIFSTLNLFFRDLERFVTLGIMLLFYCTPILYGADMIPKQYAWIISYNPLANMILAWRDLLMNGYLDYMHMLYLYVSGIVVLMIGMWIFNKLKFRFAEIL